MESLTDKAARIQREAKFEERRKRFIKSEESVNAAHSDIDRLLSVTQEHAGRLSLKFTPSRAPREASVFATHAAMMVHWHGYAANDSELAYLEVSYWGGPPPMWGVHYWDEPPPKLGTIRYQIDLRPSGEPA